MSKQSALNMAMGSSAPVATPSLIVSPAVAKETIAPAPVTAPAAPVVPAQVQTKEDVNASRLALFAKKEAQLRKQQEDFKREREENQKIVKQAQDYNSKWTEFEALKAKDKIAAMKMAGFTETDIFNFMAESKAAEAKTPDQIAADLAKTVEAKVDEKLEARDQKISTEQNAKLITNFKTKIHTDLRQKAEKYELSAFEGKEAEDLAYHFVVEHLKANDELLTVDQALEKAEKFYELKEQQKRERVKKLSPQQAAQAAITPAAPVNQSTRQPTLTNKVTATTGSTVAASETKAQKRSRLEQALRDGTVIR